jgi:Putative peptidoglycan binding domain
MEESMKQTLLATVAALALSVPALAASNVPAKNVNMQPNQAQQTQNGNTQAQNNDANGQQRVNPMRLSRNQIRQIQRKLGEKGFSPGSVDGLWGPHTASAVRNFRKDRNIRGKGFLTRNTLAALGVGLANNKGASSSTPAAAQNTQPQTVGAAPGASSSRSATTGMGKSGSSSSSTNGLSDNNSSGSSTNGMGTNGSSTTNSQTPMSPQKNK